MKIAVVTGASSGIGAATARRLAGEGFFVVAAARRRERLAALVDEVGGLAVPCDVTSDADVTRLTHAVAELPGDLHLLVNNAGVAPSVRADILDADEESFDRVLGINLKGPYFLTQLVARRMIASSVHGKIVIVSSISAYAASVNRGDYCLAKAGLAMMTKLYAARLAEHGINVYEIRPGIVETDMTGAVKEKYDELILNQGLTPIRRWGQPSDVGRAVVAIATDLLPFSTGQVLDVDGGFHLRTL
jgi:3-oxoacyl-[acyl-carrier protein] reductase